MNTTGKDTDEGEEVHLKSASPIPLRRELLFDYQKQQ